MLRRIVILAALTMTVAVTVVHARDENLRILEELSVDQRLDFEVTSVAKLRLALHDESRGLIERDVMGEVRWLF